MKILLILCSITLGWGKNFGVLFVGDSLTQGYGVKREEAFPALVEKELKKKNPNVSVFNSGASGATTASGLKLFRWHVKKKPNLVIISLGANDGLRGISLESSKKNLSDLIDLAQNSGSQVILSGMLLPPNYGEKYRMTFKKMYEDLAKEKKIPMIPFLLNGVAGEKKYNQDDGIHPNSQGHEKVAKNVLKHITSFIPSVGGSKCHLRYQI